LLFNAISTLKAANVQLMTNLPTDTEKIVEDCAEIQLNSNEMAGHYKVSQMILFESAEWLIYFFFRPKELANNQSNEENQEDLKKLEEKIK